MECPFCYEFENKHLPELLDGIGDRILYESENFVVFPSLGQIVEGYLLIAAKKHYVNMGEVPIRLYPELEEVYGKVKEALKITYGTPIFFEHGPVSAIKKAGCCIDHAHIHALPAQIDILPEIAKHFCYSKIDSFDTLKKQYDSSIPYFFYESYIGDRYLFNVPEVVPSQYLRQIVAYKIGQYEKWNWRAYLGLEELTNTIRTLNTFFS